RSDAKFQEQNFKPWHFNQQSGLRIADEPAFFDIMPKSLILDDKTRILCPRAELNFENIELKPFTELNNAVEKALKHHNPYHELLKVFKTYGHFLPKSIIFGHRLYRACHLDIKENSLQFTDWEDFDFVTYNNNLLNKWENYTKFHNLSTSTNDEVMISINNGKIVRDDLKEWVNSCLESNIDSWQ
ncbi:524_t:CDS:2, partial [Dentiscutata heterogama]